MKKLATLALLSLLAAAPAFAAELTLPQLLEKNHQARGGDAAWKALKGVRLEGVFEVAPGMSAPFVLVYSGTDRMRMDFEMQGMKVTQVLDKGTGWHQMPFMGSPDPQVSNPEQVKQAKRMADFSGPLFDSAKKGYQLELLGREDVAGTPAYKIKLTQDGESSTLYVDANTFLEFQEIRQATGDQGQEIVLVITMGDYKTVGGLVIPHSIQTKIQGTPQGQSVTIKTVELNPTIPADHFKMPPPAPKPAAAPQPAPGQ